MWHRFVRPSYFEESKVEHPKLQAIMADPVQKEKYLKLQKMKAKVLRNDKIIAEKNKIYR